MEKGVIKELIGKMPQVGNIELISIRPTRRELPVSVDKVKVSKENGLEGDHFASTYSAKRQVTLIQKEHLDAVANILGKDKVDPLLTRRNIVVSGINLLALKDQEFSLGESILRGTGYCHPCSRMEENLGEGGYNAMRGHGGITAEVVKDGHVKTGDEVKLLG